MIKTPAGLTSSVTADGKKYILQTEFLLAPEPRIITTVDYQGQVIHKVEKLFLLSLDDPDSYAQAEKAVKGQHISVARVIAARPRDFASRSIEIEVSIADKLRVIPGVAEVMEIDAELLSGNKASQTIPQLKASDLSAIRNLILSICKNSRLGRLRRAAAVMDGQRFLLAGASGKTFLVCLRPDTDISRMMTELDAVGL